MDGIKEVKTMIWLPELQWSTINSLYKFLADLSWHLVSWNYLKGLNIIKLAVDKKIW